MNAIKSMILTWLWKIGYKAGKSIAVFGDNIFTDAVLQGVKTHIETSTSFSTNKLEATLEELSTDITSLVSAAEGTAMLATMSATEMMEIFVGMFADEGDDADNVPGKGAGTASYEAAHALFSNHINWTADIGIEETKFTSKDDPDTTFTIAAADGSLVPTTPADAV